MNNKIDIDNIIKKYIFVNNLVIIQHNCVYINTRNLYDLKKIFYKNIDIRKLYNISSLCAYNKEYAIIFYNKTKPVYIEKSRNYSNLFNHDYEWIWAGRDTYDSMGQYTYYDIKEIDLLKTFFEETIVPLMELNE